MRGGNQLSVGSIIDTAIEIADSDGLEAVSMRQLAARLSVTPMALYWHFANRSELLDGMATTVIGEVRVCEVTADPWEQQLRAALEAVAQVLVRHRWMGAVVSSRYVRTEPYLRLLETLIGLIRLAGLEMSTAIAILDVGIDTLVTAASGAVELCDPDPELVAYFSALDGHPHVRDAARYLAAPTPGRIELAIEMVIDAVRVRARPEALHREAESEVPPRG